jgi:prophage regulatory protein
MQALLALPATLAATALKRSSLYALISANEFPQPVKVGARRIAFVQAEVDAWIKGRIADRDGGKGGAA